MTVNFSPANTFATFKGHCLNNCTCPECGRPFTEDKPDDKPKSKGFLTVAKDKFIDFRKFFVDCKHMIAGACKGAVQGSVLGGLTAGAAVTINALKHSEHLLGWKGKVLAGTVALGTMAVNMFTAKLDANEEKAALDHRWATGHNE